jgi:arylsulfatase A-like enzyme
MRYLKICFGLLLVFLVLQNAGSGLLADDSRPNILFVVIDDLGYGELGCYGGTEIPTPHIDSLAASGARFTNGYVTASYCAPSRAALLTGRYQSRFGFDRNPVGARNTEPGVGLPVTERTLADRLRDVGYVTGLVGKWHLGATAPFHPQRRGFDEFFGFLHEGHYFVPPPWDGVTTWLRRKALPDGSKGRWSSPSGRIHWTTHMGHREPDYDADNPLLRNSQPVSESAYLTDAFTREACDFVTRHSQQPWFLYLAYNAVHSPMQATDAWMDQFSHIQDPQRRIFAAMLAHADDGVGTVLRTLEATGTRDNTLVFFLSDNGGPTKELTSSNRPLRGGKGDLHEGGIRIPWILSWPGRIPPGTVIDEPVISMDATATALQLANAQIESAPLDGQSLLSADRKMINPPSGRHFCWRSGVKRAIRKGPWKMVAQGDAWQLFDLATDASESRDVSRDHPDTVLELKTHWETWNREQAATL